MIKYIYLFLLILLPLSNVCAEDVTLNWDASPTPEVVGYKIYYKLNSTELPFDGIGAIEGPSPVDVGDTLSSTLTGLIDNSIYYFTVTAYDAAGYESSYSNIISNQEMVTLSRPLEGAVDEPSPVTFQWDFSSTATLNYTLYYGTDRDQVTSAAGITAPIESPPVSRTGLLLLLLATILALICRSLPRRRFQLATASLALTLALTACGGGGGGGDTGSTKSSTESTVAPSAAAIYSVDTGSSDYYQAYDLEPATTYYWKTVGVDAADASQVYTSTVASFTTESF